MKHSAILFLLAAFVLLAATDSILVAQTSGPDGNPRSFLQPHLRHPNSYERFPERNRSTLAKLDEPQVFDPSIDEVDPIRRLRHEEPYKGGNWPARGAGGSGFQSLTDSVQEAWVARYNGPGNSWDEGFALAIDDSAYVYVTGYSFGSGTASDYTTIKYSPNGVELWIARYNGLGDSYDEAHALAVDNSGNVYVTGFSYGSGTNYDYATIKYSPDGVELWIARYNGPGNSDDRAFSLAVEDSGNVYVAGYSGGPGTGPDYATIKYSPDGVQRWVARYNGPGNSADYALPLAVDGSGNVYVTGESIGSGTSFDMVTIQYSPDGVQQWLARYNGPGNSFDGAHDLAVDSSGNVYVTGISFSSGTTTAADYATIKYSPDGVQQWVARYNGPGNDQDSPRALAIDPSGNVYVTGWSRGSGTSEDYATIKYSPEGAQQWVARYNGTSNAGDWASRLAVDNLGNVYVTGESWTSGADYDYATIKYSPDGVQQWLARYNGPGNSEDAAYALAVDGSGNVYVTGYSTGSGTSWDHATISYVQILVSVEEQNPEIPSVHYLSQNYPNPFNPSTTIHYALIGNFHTTLKIYNLLGQEIIALVDHVQSVGVYEVSWDGKDRKGQSVPSGMYIYRLESGQFSDGKKMLIVK